MNITGSGRIGVHCSWARCPPRKGCVGRIDVHREARVECAGPGNGPGDHSVQYRQHHSCSTIDD